MHRSNIVNGKVLAASISERIKLEVAQLNSCNIIPSIKIIMVGNNPASQVYVRNKLRLAHEVGIDAELIALPDHITEDKLIAVIEQLNQDSTVSGIVIQLPLPIHLKASRIINIINPNKDIDGFHPLNLGKLFSGDTDGLIACTPVACLKILQHIESNLEGMHAVIIGRSNIVGRPLAALLLNYNITVTICHSATRNLAEISSKADVVICAVGKPLYFGEEYFHKDAIVIDVGISRVQPEGRLVGDVNFFEVANKVRKITPVPGGVGPMTVACILENTVKATKMLAINC